MMNNKILFLDVSSAHQGSIIITLLLLQFKMCEYVLNCNLFLWCAAVFSASLLQSSVSHDLQKS